MRGCSLDIDKKVLWVPYNAFTLEEILGLRAEFENKGIAVIGYAPKPTWVKRFLKRIRGEKYPNEVF